MKAKYLVLDVDGTLTDGKIYMGPNGEAFKAFSIKDGCGIYDIYPKHGGTVIIITARESEIVKRRCEELKVKYLFQGVRDKAGKLVQLAEELNIAPNADGIYEDIAYMGDDIIDIPVMKICGIIGAPADAVNEVLDIADFVSEKCGGDGAVREFIEYLCEIK